MRRTRSVRLRDDRQMGEKTVAFFIGVTDREKIRLRGERSLQWYFAQARPAEDPCFFASSDNDDSRDYLA
jgi:hypothetical protein